jgi:two-component system sensor kinase FixL
MSVLPLKRPEGGASVFHLDITARHRAEVEAQRLRNDLSHVTRVSIMGELTASLAHELNQPLTAILSNTQAALRMLGNGSPDPGEFREILEDIAFDDQRAGDIITKLRQLMKKGQFQLQPVELNNVVLDVSTLLESDALIREMTIEHELTPNLPPVRGDRIQLQQVLLNLMLNGLEAMRTSPHDSRRKLLVSTHNDAQKVSVAVTDAGTGIPLERLDSIFEPFYTTKPDGMGMGLSISRSILIALGGRITGRNNPDRGATFEFELPVMTENQP